MNLANRKPFPIFTCQLLSVLAVRAAHSPIVTLQIFLIWYNIPYAAKLSSGKTFVVRVQNFHSWEIFVVACL